MRTVVTGGGGFLGTHVVARLQAEGIEPIVARRRDYDLTRWDDTERLFHDTKPELVIHLAAEVGGIGANRANPGRYWYANLMMGAHVIEQSHLHGVDKVVLLGTVCAYPKFAPVPFREEDLWNGYPEETNAPYGVAKKALLVGAQTYREQYGLHAIYLLPVNLYGPRDNFDLETSHVIPALIRKMLEAEERGETEVVLWGDGSPTREFLYVDDCAEGIVLRRAGAREPRHRRGDPDQGARLRDRRSHGLRRRHRLGHVEAERPAAAQARHDAREGAVRVRSEDAVPGGDRAHGRLVPGARVRLCGSLSGSGDSPGSSSYRSWQRNGSPSRSSR
jgi:GDP-L-fucose synthase